MTCTICRHEKRREIDDAILSGIPSTEIARNHGPSPDSIGRHRDCIRKALARVDRKIVGRVAARVDTLADQLEDMAKEAHEQLKLALPLVDGEPASLREFKAAMLGRDRSAALFLATARELRPTYELAGKLNGEIQAASVAAFLAALGVQNESEVRSALHLARSAQAPSFEECREEGVALLKLVMAERPEWRQGILAQLESGAVLLGAHEDDESGNGVVRSSP